MLFERPVAGRARTGLKTARALWRETNAEATAARQATQNVQAPISAERGCR